MESARERKSARESACVRAFVCARVCVWEGKTNHSFFRRTLLCLFVSLTKNQISWLEKDDLARCRSSKNLSTCLWSTNININNNINNNNSINLLCFWQHFELIPPQSPMTTTTPKLISSSGLVQSTNHWQRLLSTKLDERASCETESSEAS